EAVSPGCSRSVSGMRNVQQGAERRSGFPATSVDHTEARKDASRPHAVGGFELVNGLFLEATFALVTSRPTGYQFAFFRIQGPVALASAFLERLARRGTIAGRIRAYGAMI